MMVFGAGLLAEEPVGEQPIAPEDLRSGLAFQSPETQALQRSDGANPAILWVEAGAQSWREAAGSRGRSCASCHDDAKRSMRGVAARYPAIDQPSGQLINLEQRINLCRTRHQDTTAHGYETDELLGLAAYVASQSRGMSPNVKIDGSLQPYFQAGRAFYQRRQGQLNISCAQCHDENWGRMLRGDTISQGHSNAYPIYRLEWQTMGSLHRRLRACSAGMRAVMYEPGSKEYVALELYLAWRAAGLEIETPGVRR